MVVLLMLIPLLAPSESGAPAGLTTIAKALGIAALKVHILHGRSYPGADARITCITPAAAVDRPISTCTEMLFIAISLFACIYDDS